jgi:hypothetical protein
VSVRVYFIDGVDGYGSMMETTLINVASDTGETQYDLHTDHEGNYPDTGRPYGTHINATKDTPYGTIVFAVAVAQDVLGQLPGVLAAFDTAKTASAAGKE